MNVVIYARFSSHSQTEQSIEGQLRVCYEYANAHNYTVIGEYIDRAQSGTSDNRQDFQRMIQDSEKKTFQFVLVYQLDRFARNRYDSAIHKAKLKKNGVRVLSAKENITDDASGILIEGVLESMAEYYSVELAQKINGSVIRVFFYLCISIFATHQRPLNCVIPAEQTREKKETKKGTTSESRCGIILSSKLGHSPRALF